MKKWKIENKSFSQEPQFSRKLSLKKRYEHSRCLLDINVSPTTECRCRMSKLKSKGTNNGSSITSIRVHRNSAGTEKEEEEKSWYDPQTNGGRVSFESLRKWHECWSALCRSERWLSRQTTQRHDRANTDTVDAIESRRGISLLYVKLDLRRQKVEHGWPGSCWLRCDRRDDAD